MIKKLFLLKKYKKFFDNINGKSLDRNQRNAILNDKDSILVIAGAGSGKTLTIIGKIKYLIEIKNIDPKAILCISFTNETTKDLKKSIKKCLKYDIEVKTFHKLAIKILSINKITFKLVDDVILLNIIKKQINNDPKEIERIIYTAINLYKASGYIKSLETINNDIQNEKNDLLKKRNKHLFNIFVKCLNDYDNYLYEHKELDFNDLIYQASLLVNEKYYPKYQYIIIDEFQDTSYIRYLLIKNLKERNNCHLFCVGDDYQSIYKFTGCSLDIFLKFKTFFKKSKILKIKNTYRNSQELIDIAGKFIKKNPFQIKKKLKSIKKLKKPIIIYLYEKEEEIDLLLNYIGKKEILLLYRNNNDIEYLKENYDMNGKYLNYNGKNIKHLTVHKSKGLESDTIIIYKVNDEKIGFPNKINDDHFLNYIKEIDQYEYEEERRLFYVALTRSKEEVYLFVNKYKKSVFIKELIKENKKNIKILSKEQITNIVK